VRIALEWLRLVYNCLETKNDKLFCVYLTILKVKVLRKNMFRWEWNCWSYRHFDSFRFYV